MARCSWLLSATVGATIVAAFVAVPEHPRLIAEVAPYVVVLGIAQDAGYPHAGCRKDCCLRAWRDPRLRRQVAALGIVDPRSGGRWLVEATPDFPAQLERLRESSGGPRAPLAREASLAENLGLSGVFLTHAHIGHYTGLMYLGREGIGARAVPVFALPRMRAFLAANGPWSQLVALGNIELRPLAAGRAQAIAEGLTVEPLLVPHRDEFSETVGFLISGPSRKVLFLPDIDKWERWSRRIEDVLTGVDRAYLDGTFYADGEIPGRSMAEIPHPFIAETLARFAARPVDGRGSKKGAEIRFLHLNHTNPALDPASAERAAIERAGMAVAQEGERFGL